MYLYMYIYICIYKYIHESSEGVMGLSTLQNTLQHTLQHTEPTTHQIWVKPIFHHH